MDDLSMADHVEHAGYVRMQAQLPSTAAMDIRMSIPK
jgi:hypothetical protein